MFHRLLDSRIIGAPHIGASTEYHQEQKIREVTSIRFFSLETICDDVL